ncbi:MAG: FKBP-type peptidyl-prolyl cis-trans isomerase [Bdellovibrionales bacterium]
MKKLLVLGLGLSLVAACTQKKNVTIKTDEDKAAYAIGQEIGRGMKSQGLEINVDIVAASIEDALKGAEPRISKEEQQTAMQTLRKTMMEKQSKMAEANTKKGSDFLEANKKKEGVKVTESGLQYKVLTEGKGKKPKETDVVKVHYKGTLIDGSEFDSSYARKEPAEFPVNRVIKGWIEALQMMTVGSKYELVIPSELAYGAMARPGIPANSVLVFEVELLDIVKK